MKRSNLQNGGVCICMPKKIVFTAIPTLLTNEKAQ